MSFFVYDPDFSNRKEISHVISLQMSEYYNNIGKITIVAPINQYNIDSLTKNSIVYETKRKSTYILKNIRIDTVQGTMTANGYTTNSIINNRIVARQFKITNVESGCYKAITDNLRGLPRVSVSPAKGFPQKTDVLLEEDEALNAIIPVLEPSGLGHRMLFDHSKNQFTFEIYEGKDLTKGIKAVTFSEERGTAKNLVVTTDDSVFKNVAYVKADFGERTLTEIVGNATGGDRYEQFFNVSLSSEEQESESSFRSRMREQGKKELSELIKRQTFSVSIEPKEYGTVYNIGDIVNCSSKRFGISFQARINGVKYKVDANGESIDVVLGEPILTVIDEVKLNGRN